MIIKIGIVEDNNENIQTLKYILSQLEIPLDIAGEAQTKNEAYEMIKNNDLDLLFLDIQLRKGNIFEVLRQLYIEGISLPEMIFVTAHGSFENALNAIRFSCIDFVTKPIDKTSIKLALEKYQNKVITNEFNVQKQVGFLLDLLKKDIQRPQSIAVNLIKGVIEFIDLDQIVYILADKNMAILKLKNGNTLKSVKHLGHYIDLLYNYKEFVQISKSILVNTTHLKRYISRDKTLYLQNGDILIASHRFSRNLRQKLMELQQDKPGIWDRLFGK
ncbi:MAG TPA: response regulator transcription factor [Bacteroidetes bacterium]|nr:response regulator transcription factor [Bacteroidota bacterium]